VERVPLEGLAASERWASIPLPDRRIAANRKVTLAVVLREMGPTGHW